MKIGIVTDEISLNIEEAFKYCKEWGIHLVELRCLQSGRIPKLDESEFDKLVKLKMEYNIQVTALSPGIFKTTLIEKEKILDEINNILPKTIEYAEKLDCKNIISFGFQRGKADSDDKIENLIDYFGQTANLLNKYGMNISIENEPGFWCDSGSNTADILSKINLPNLGSNWDPANAYGTGEEPFPDGYQKIKKWISNVHVKDTSKGSLVECCTIDEGNIDWDGQIKSLIEDKIVPHVTIETHCLPLIEKSKKNVEILSELMKKYKG